MGRGDVAVVPCSALAINSMAAEVPGESDVGDDSITLSEVLGEYMVAGGLRMGGWPWDCNGNAIRNINKKQWIRRLAGDVLRFSVIDRFRNMASCPLVVIETFLYEFIVQRFWIEN